MKITQPGSGKYVSADNFIALLNSLVQCMMLACVAICSLLACSVFAAGGHGREYGVVNSDGTRLRTAANPNNSQNIIGLLYTGDIMLFDINSNGDSIYVLGTDNQYWGYGVMQSGANTGMWIRRKHRAASIRIPSRRSSSC